MPLIDGDPVDSWTEKQTSTALTAAGANRPTFKTSIINGHDVVRFDGTDNELDGGSLLSAISGDAGFSIVVVTANLADSGATGFGSFVSRDGGGDRGINLFLDNVDDTVSLDIPVSAGSTRRRESASGVYNAGKAIIITGVYDGSGGTMDVYRNKVLDNGSIDGSVPATIANAGPDLKVGVDGFNDHLTGDIAELLMYRFSLSTVQREAIYDDLATTYLPATPAFPGSVTADFWLEASDNSSVGDTNPVVGWTDRISHIDVYTIAPANEATYQASVINSLPVVRFDGTNDAYQGTTILADISGDTGYTVFIVATSIADSGGAAFGSFMSRDSASRGINFFTDDATDKFSINVSINASSVARRESSSTVYTGDIILMGRFDGGTNSLDIYINNTLDNGTLTGSVPSSIGNAGGNLIIGSDGFGNEINADVAEIIYYRQALDTTDRNAVYSSLATKYGI
jgi:hypothetical protein